MALADEVIARYSARRLKELTNPDATSASAYDATRLAAAATDAAARFATLVGATFDLTNARHVDVAVEGVIAILKVRGGLQDGKDALEAFVDACNKLANSSTRGRLLASTDSPIVPTEIDSGPGFSDPSIWRHFAPDSPASSPDDDLPLDP